MPERWSWQRIGPSEEGLRLVARILRRGALVALPSESGFVLAVSALDEPAVSRLREWLPEAPLELFVEGRAGARDWLPELGPAGRRVADRMWPGSLAIVSSEGIESGLASRVSQQLRAALVGPDGLQLRRPRHPAAEQVLRRLGGPLIGVTLSDATGKARRLLEQADLIVEDEVRQTEAVTALRVHGATWNVLRGGSLSEDDVARQFARWVVFVCTGNTCRSPMAEVICQKLLAERLGCQVEELPRRGWVVASAGLSATPGMPAAAEAAEVARTHGGDLGRHRSQQLTEELAARADYLFGMTTGHVRALEHALPGHPGEVRLLCPQGIDVDDPIGQPMSAYESCARQLREYIEEWVASLPP